MTATMKVYYVYFRYKPPGEKKPGPVRHFRVYARNEDEARKFAAEQARYPDLEVIEVKEA
jgi:hypothetical protein